MVMGYARYGSREIQVRHYGGTWFVVRRDQYPHTTGSPMVTRDAGRAVRTAAMLNSGG